jgi:hypothetical protein
MKKRFRETRLAQVIGLQSNKWSPKSITKKIIDYVMVRYRSLDQSRHLRVHVFIERERERERARARVHIVIVVVIVCLCMCVSLVRECRCVCV